MTDGETLDVSLISHTNAGKTTLARTLLGRDVGEVRDAPHVTAEATPYTLQETDTGDRLVLWDTPGFGDSARLARRLSQQGNPIGWFLSSVWDRYRDRTFWLTQLAVRNVRERADAVLYLVNAAEAPADAGYLAPELEVLDWIGKPVIVLLNQTGPPKGRADEAADEARWRDALGRWGKVREVLTLDAFARCWVQERTLFAALARALPDTKRSVLDRLVAAWTTRRRAQFDAAVAALAAPIARAAVDRELLPADPLLAKLSRSLGIARTPDASPEDEAVRAMGERLAAGLETGNGELIAVHGLQGRAAAEVARRLATDVRTEAPVDEGKAAVMGGIVSGALTGLTADLAAGGLTFGAGMLAGAVLGALGAAGVARGVNVARGRLEATVRWDDTFLDGLVASALLRYLAVAHYGRGRGEWTEGEYPAFWRDLVTRTVVARQAEFDAVWALRVGADAANVERALGAAMAGAARALLEELYPGALDDADPASPGK